MKKFMINKYFKKNIDGSDYVVGDIHGHYNELIRDLQKVNFNYETDRLFAVGDLIDRGPDSEMVLSLLDENWFFSSLGNHEHMMVESFDGNDELTRTWFHNGGEWFFKKYYDKPELFSEILEDWEKKIFNLPINLTIETELGNVGICHAEVAYFDWNDQTSNEIFDADIMRSIWGRTIIKNQNFPELVEPVKNVIKTYHGHTPVKEPVKINNMNFIDTFAYSGSFTILKL